MRWAVLPLVLLPRVYNIKREENVLLQYCLQRCILKYFWFLWDIMSTHVLVKALPQKKIALGWGRETNTAQGKAEFCIGLKTHARVLHIAQAWQCFNWCKAFLVDKLFVLATFFQNCLRTCCISKECFMESIALLFLFMFNHTNTLKSVKECRQCHQ